MLKLWLQRRQLKAYVTLRLENMARVNVTRLESEPEHTMTTTREAGWNIATVRRDLRMAAQPDAINTWLYESRRRMRSSAN